MDAWVTIFYQIVKLTYVARISPKTFRVSPYLPEESIIIPQYYLEGSNLFSPHENLLLRWLELNFQVVNPHQNKRLFNFDT